MKIIWDTFIKWGWLVGDQALVLTHVGPSVHYLGATCGLDIRLHRALLAKWPCPKPLWAPPELSFVFEHSSTPQKKLISILSLPALSKFFSASSTNLRPRPCTEGENPEKVSHTQMQRLNTTVFLCLVLFVPYLKLMDASNRFATLYSVLQYCHIWKCRYNLVSAFEKFCSSWNQNAFYNTHFQKIKNDNCRWFIKKWCEIPERIACLMNDCL